MSKRFSIEEGSEITVAELKAKLSQFDDNLLVTVPARVAAIEFVEVGSLENMGKSVVIAPRGEI